MSRPLPRYTDTTITTDPLEIAHARREAQIAEAQHKISQPNYATNDPQDLRGIPCIAQGVGGTSPGTHPLTEAVRTLMAQSRRA